jgi:hypothetical protein
VAESLIGVEDLVELEPVRDQRLVTATESLSQQRLLKTNLSCVDGSDCHGYPCPQGPVDPCAVQIVACMLDWERRATQRQILPAGGGPKKQYRLQRPTLNILLSFAQFKREVAGERIRDKIAASKKKGHVDGGVCRHLVTTCGTRSWS